MCAREEFFPVWNAIVVWISLRVGQCIGHSTEESGAPFVADWIWSFMIRVEDDHACASRFNQIFRAQCRRAAHTHEADTVASAFGSVRRNREANVSKRL